jgi:hypothetical protein
MLVVLTDSQVTQLASTRSCCTDRPGPRVSIGFLAVLTCTHDDIKAGYAQGIRQRARTCQNVRVRPPSVEDRPPMGESHGTTAGRSADQRTSGTSNGCIGAVGVGPADNCADLTYSRPHGFDAKLYTSAHNDMRGRRTRRLWPSPKRCRPSSAARYGWQQGPADYTSVPLPLSRSVPIVV